MQTAWSSDNRYLFPSTLFLFALILGSVAVRNSYYGQGQASFVMRRLSCSSSHTSLIACDQYFDNSIAIACGVNNAASVVCLGKQCTCIYIVYDNL